MRSIEWSFKFNLNKSRMISSFLKMLEAGRRWMMDDAVTLNADSHFIKTLLSSYGRCITLSNYTILLIKSPLQFTESVLIVDMWAAELLCRQAPQPYSVGRLYFKIVEHNTDSTTTTQPPSETISAASIIQTKQYCLCSPNKCFKGS